MAARPIEPAVCIGHAHLKVADLERAVAFHSEVLGFEVTQRYGPGAAGLAAGPRAAASKRHLAA
jgi:catechol 2,3-dioxygenase